MRPVHGLENCLNCRARLVFVFLVQILMALEILGNFFPDLSCFPSYDPDSMALKVAKCDNVANNPLNRNCHKSCMLESLLIATPPDVSLLSPTSDIITSGKYGVMQLSNDAPLNLSLTRELKLVLSDEDAISAARKIAGNCGDILNRMINVERRSCEDWQPIYACIDKALCLDGLMYPDMTCHGDYRKDVFRREWNLCRKKTMLPTSRSCLKACMLVNLGLLENTDPTPKLRAVQAGQHYFFRQLYNFFDGLSWHQELGEKLIENLNVKCGDIFDQTVVQNRLSCDNWTELYECIEKALGCDDVNAELISLRKSTGRGSPLTDIFHSYKWLIGTLSALLLAVH